MNSNEINKWKKDKVYQYWQKTYLNNTRKSIILNNIKIKNKNYQGLNEVEETTNKNGKIFYKQYKYTDLELKNYLDKKKNNYKIVYQNNTQINDSYSNFNNFNNNNFNYIHPEYNNKLNGSLSFLSHKNSFFK